MTAKRGRKNKHFSRVQPRLAEIEQWCKDGLIEAEICKRLGVGWTAWHKYKREFPYLTNTLRKGKAIADNKIAAIRGGLRG